MTKGQNISYNSLPRCACRHTPYISCAYLFTTMCRQTYHTNCFHTH